MNGSKLILFCCLFGFVLLGLSQAQTGAHANSGVLWQDVSLRSVQSVRGADRPLPAEFRLLKANEPLLRQQLLAAPEFLAGDAPTELDLPLPNGALGRFAVQSAPIMEPELAAKYPRIKTFVVKGIDDPTATGRLDLTPAGFHGYVQSAAGEFFIDPYAGGDVTHYISYMKPDAQREPKQYVEAAPNQTDPFGQRGIQSTQIDLGDVKRTYQIAMSATGEFTATQCAQPGAQCTFDDQTRETALAAIVTGMNRVTQIYEREFAVSFILANNTDELIFTDADNDPYSEELELYTLIDEFVGAADQELPISAYDLGHVLGGGENAGGGLAFPFTCDATESYLKLTGATTIDEPVGDPFWVDYVAHEIGHQFGADHSYNASAGGGCTSRVASFAFEPGGGSTIMSYAGICEDQNIQNSVDGMFNAGAYVQIAQHITTEQGAGCEDQIVTGNSAPVVDAGNDYVVPRDTPFVLTAVVEDAEQSAAELTTSWEQYSLGAAWPFESILPNTDQQDGSTRPILRVFAPSSSPERIVPSLANILDGTYENSGEDLPSINQVMTFRATVRDNAAGSGGVSSDDMRLTVEQNAGPFRVTSHNTTETVEIIETNTPIAINWDVAATDRPPVSCSSVTVSFSADGGQTFDYILKSETANDGAETVLVPSILPVTSNGRIKVACTDNIFFDINKGNLEVVEGEPINFTDVIFLPNVVR